jgi:Zn-dependent peptidase ImmA (M78 family)
LLMPRPWLKRAYAHGIQRLPELAARFGVSQLAMQVRLNQIGLTEPAPRCSRSRPGWTLQAETGAGTPATYARTTAEQSSRSGPGLGCASRWLEELAHDWAAISTNDPA